MEEWLSIVRTGLGEAYLSRFHHGIVLSIVLRIGAHGMMHPIFIALLGEILDTQFWECVGYHAF